MRQTMRQTMRKILHYPYDNTFNYIFKCINIYYMDNISMHTVEKQTQQQQPQPQTSITDVNITDENTALNVMVSFLHLAQKRGAFNLQESAKVWECVRLFMKQ